MAFLSHEDHVNSHFTLSTDYYDDIKYYNDIILYLIHIKSATKIKQQSFLHQQKYRPIVIHAARQITYIMRNVFKHSVGCILVIVYDYLFYLFIYLLGTFIIIGRTYN